MQIIKYPHENDIKVTCQECNTFFSYTRKEVQIVEYEEEAELANYRRTGLFRGEYFVNIYKQRKAVIFCPYCKTEIKVGLPIKFLKAEKIGERVLTKQEIKDWNYPIY